MHPASEELFAYRDGELTPDKRAVIEAHVIGCSVCRALIDQVSALEAELRQAPTPAPPGYLDELSESVRSRIAAAASGDVMEPAPDVAKERVAEHGGRAGRFVDDRRERGRIKEAPKLPWAAVVGTVSAAAAVLVVVVILIRQGPYQSMTPVLPEKKSEPMMQRAAGGEGEKQQPAKELDKTKAGARDEKIVAEQKVTTSASAPSESNAPVEPPAAAKTDADLKNQLADRADQLAKDGRARAQAPLGAASNESSKLYQEEAQGRVQAAPEAAAPRAMAKRESMITEAGYKTILDRYGLPPVWNERVSPSSLASAEPELRSYYMSGIAGNDSARVRLYLAEAARLRYGSGDTELYDEIKHHYQRVIELAGPDAEVARVARDRLRSLEK